MPTSWCIDAARTQNLKSQSPLPVKKPRIDVVVVSRPDAIKSAPVCLELRRHAAVVETLLVSTGQHRKMPDQVFRVFEIAADVDLNIMQHGHPFMRRSFRESPFSRIENPVD